MTRIYQDAADKYITAKVYYASNDTHKIYVDEALETPANIAEITDAFFKGVLIVNVAGAFAIASILDGNELTIGGTVYTAEVE